MSENSPRLGGGPNTLASLLFSLALPKELRSRDLYPHTRTDAGLRSSYQTTTFTPPPSNFAMASSVRTSDPRSAFDGLTFFSSSPRGAPGWRSNSEDWMYLSETDPESDDRVAFTYSQFDNHFDAPRATSGWKPPTLWEEFEEEVQEWMIYKG